MKNHNGINIPANYLPSFEWVRDLQYFEGSLISEVKTTKGELYVFIWCDCNNKLNRWIAAKTTKRSIYLLTSGIVTIREFLNTYLLDDNVYLLDINEKFSPENATYLHLNELNDKYLPQEGVYLSKDLIPKALSNEYPVLIEKHWNSEELALFPRKFMDAYSLIQKFISSTKKYDGSITDLPWNGGGSSVSFYSDLRNEIGNNLGVNAIQYASPGYFLFKGNRSIGELLENNIQKYISDKENVDMIFNQMSSYLRDNELNTENIILTKKQEDWLEKNGASLMSCFSEPSWKWLHKNTGNTFVAVKVAMSYYRRIKPLSEFVISKKATFS